MILSSLISTLFRGRAKHVCFGVATVLVVAEARAATEEQVLDQGRKLYESGKYKETVEWFAQAIDGSPPTLKEPALVAKGRMYSGAAYMAIQDYGKADQQFDRLLRADMKFQPDALAFPPGVIDELNRVRKKIEKEDADKAAADAKKKEIDALKLKVEAAQKQIADLKLYASTERVVTRNSRVLASLPFGVGQFQNGDPSLGLMFAGVEGVSLITATVSFFYHRSNPNPGEEVRTLVTSARIVNWISVGTLAAFAIGGIVQANVSFVPERWETRKRPLPPSLAVVPVVTPTTGGVYLGALATF